MKKQRLTAEKMFPIIRQQMASDKTIKSFIEPIEISRKVFFYWKKKYLKSLEVNKNLSKNDNEKFISIEPVTETEGHKITIQYKQTEIKSTNIDLLISFLNSLKTC